MIGLVLSLLLWLAPLVEPAPRPEPSGQEAEQLRTAKALFFDRRYGEARDTWQAVLARSSGAQAATASYWVARCSESLGQGERAFGEYGAFLSREPADAALREEARTSRVTLATRLVKQGREEFRAPLREAIKDPSASVRYLAAVQLASLGECAGAVVPVLRTMAREDDDDLVQRARLGLLRCDPKGVGARTAAGRPRGDTRWLHLRIFEKPGTRAKITLNVPVSLAEILYKSLPEDAKKDLTRQGYDADTFWERLNRMPGGKILEIEGEDGGRIQLWIE